MEKKISRLYSDKFNQNSGGLFDKMMVSNVLVYPFFDQRVPGSWVHLQPNQNPTVSEMQSMWTWPSFRAANQILAKRLLQFVNVSPPLGRQIILSWGSFGREVDEESFRLRELHYSAFFYANVIPNPAEPE